jgi:two-component system response regulator GlrR
LVEPTLFGYVKGAFTGADTTKRGLLQQAEGGTFFLDEISELPLNLQVKFLRVLQEREFYPVGAGRPSRVDIRLVAATNQDLAKAVSAGRFREDLYYRVQVVPVFLPPLRERPEDIPRLAQHFLRRFSREMSKDIRGFAPEVLQQLMQHDWPGNVRELANAVERAVVFSSHDTISGDLLLLGNRERPNARCESLSLKEAREHFEKAYLVQVMTEVQGNVSRAAEMAGKDRAEFYKLLRKYTLDPAIFKGGKSPE